MAPPRLAAVALLALLLRPPYPARAADLSVSTDGPPGPGGMSLAGAGLVVDDDAAPVVHQAAELLADDLRRVTGDARTNVDQQPLKSSRMMPAAPILIGTIGDGGLVDRLATDGKIDVADVRGRWETFAWQLIDYPPGQGKCLVVVGSDRRGTAYGCTELSRAIGVSPWNWWADVPVQHHAQLTASPGRHVDGPPGVKYRGIFLNDEDFGLRPWAGQTFDPDGKRTEIGPKTYAKLFELMLRLRLNLLWPAMHPGSGEFGSIPGNAAAADHWAVVMGASHCEPMLRNNVYWDKAQGPWRYDVNRANILRYWTESAEQRGDYEAVWTLGIRGIHDSPMDGPKGTPARVGMVEGVIADQRQVIDAKVTTKYGRPAELFCPYKEVLPLYDAGLRVPDDVTLVWPDDNFGYIRHLPGAAERKRSGGSGIYYHLSYWGGPQSYLWVESTPPGLIWEELHKAYQNDAGRLWVVNVGDLKPAEVAVDFYSRLAWDPPGWGPDAQDVFLRRFLTDTFGSAAAGPLFDLESTYYRLATRRKPEHFQWPRRDKRVGWLDGLSPATLDEVGHGYDDLMVLEAAAAAAVPADRRDAYFEMVGYAARALGQSGQMYVHLARAARADQPAQDGGSARTLMAAIMADAQRYNDRVAGGKWRHMMSTTMEGLDWPTQVGGRHPPGPRPDRIGGNPTGVMVDAAAFTAGSGTPAKWQPVAGLGRSGRAIVVLPATAFAGDRGPSVSFTFTLPAAVDGAAVRLHLLPTMRTDPTGQLRLAAGIDDGPPVEFPVPGGQASDENSGPRRDGVHQQPRDGVAAGHPAGGRPSHVNRQGRRSGRRPRRGRAADRGDVGSRRALTGPDAAAAWWGRARAAPPRVSHGSSRVVSRDECRYPARRGRGGGRREAHAGREVVGDGRGGPPGR